MGLAAARLARQQQPPLRIAGRFPAVSQGDGLVATGSDEGLKGHLL
jgi:hypothetical protein